MQSLDFHPDSHLKDLVDTAIGKQLAEMIMPHQHVFQELASTAKRGVICAACGYRKYESIIDQLDACHCENRGFGYHKADCKQLYPIACVKPELELATGYMVLLCPACCDDLVLLEADDPIPVFHSCGAELEPAGCTECNGLATGVTEGSDYDKVGHCEHFFREPRCSRHGGR